MIPERSVGGLTGITGWGLYGSTKFAVEGITEALAAELAPLGIYATAVEPGFFRTDFLDASSLATTLHIIEDYAETVGKMRSLAADVNHKQPGSAVKAAQAIVRLGHAEHPPVHLPLGPDTLAMFKEKMDRFNADIETWRETIVGTDHDDVKGQAAPGGAL
jgi:NAD(P)-dependent dehydrogenase (short-subunit alcohol dehydrogenase family)